MVWQIEESTVCTLFAIQILETHTNTQFQFTAVLALRRAPVETQGLPLFTMADDFFSIPPFPSPLTAASPNINHTNKVFTPEKKTENRQEMIDFMHDEEYTDLDCYSAPSNACSDLVPSLTLLILYPLFKNDLKEVPNSNNKSRNRQKLNDSLAGDNLSDQDGNIMLPNVYFNPSSRPVPLTLVH